MKNLRFVEISHKKIFETIACILLIQILIHLTKTWNELDTKKLVI